MVDLVIETSEGIRLREEIAGAGSRGAAAILDLLIFSVAAFFLLIVLLIVTSADPTGLSGFVMGWLAGGLLLFLIAYHLFCGIFASGKTIGKRVLGLTVVDLQGVPATSSQHLLRSLFWPLEVFLFVPVSLGAILIAVTERRQRLGDMVAGTVVVREHAKVTGGEPYPREQWSTLEDRRLGLVPALAERFDGEDLAFLRNLLGRRDLELKARKALFVKAALHYGSVLEITMTRKPRPQEARNLLRELYLFLRETRGAYSSSR